MTRGLNTVPGTMDRSASRRNALQSSDVRYLIPYLTELMPGKKQELDAINDHQNGKAALEGFRYFPYADFAAYQQKDFSFFIKTISSRTLATESINSENLKGHLLNSGDTYFIHDEQQYFNLMPVWNWEYLPGVTSFKGADKIKRKSFAGSIGDGNNGFTSMDYALENKDGSKFVTAKKSWFCYNGKMIGLIGALKGTGVDSAYTTLDQCRLTGAVTVNNKGQQILKGEQVLKDWKWLQHDNFLYVPLQKATATVFINDVSGSWGSINAAENNDVVRDKVFMPVIMHDHLSTAQSFAYLVSFCKTPSNAAGIANRPGFTIIKNDSVCQAIAFADGTIMAAFFEPASIAVKKMQLTTDQPCLVMIKNGSMFVSDPQQSLKNLMVTVNKKSFKIQLPENGFSTPAVLIK
jgi:chondroitin AC lyase